MIESITPTVVWVGTLYLLALSVLMWVILGVERREADRARDADRESRRGA